MKVRDSLQKTPRKRAHGAAVAWFALLVLLLVAGWGAASSVARGEPNPTPPADAGDAPDVQPTPETMPSFDDPDSEDIGDGNHYVAEIVDSTYTVGPAEFFALDLPPNPDGALAIHLSGTVNVTDKKGDIIVRLFRSSDYQLWLKKRGGEKAGPFWSSKKSRNISIDHSLKKTGPCVLLLDNGYSMRTAKHLRTQLQITYRRTEGGSAAASKPAGSDTTDDLVTPRANTEEETPPPPPPPSDPGAN